MSYVVRKMVVMLLSMMILILLLNHLPTAISQTESSQHFPPDSCNSLSDIRVNNTSIFAPVPSNYGNATADDASSDVLLTVTMHLFLNRRSAARGSAIITSIDEWITNQRSVNTSLLNTWIRKTGVNVSDIRFRVYLPSSFSSQEQTNLANSTRSHYLENITVLNESEWKKLGNGTINISTYNSTGVCTSKSEVWFNGTSSEQEIQISDTNCPAANFGENCIPDYWKRVCLYGLRQGDIFQFKHIPMAHGNISVSLYYAPALIDIPYKVYESSKFHGSFILPGEGGLYVIVSGESFGLFRYSITYRCKNMTSLIDDLMHYGLLNQKEINIVLNDVRIKPVLHGQFEYITQPPFKSPILMKNIDSTGYEYLWSYFAKAFGAAIQNEDRRASCEQIKARLINDTIIALRQPAKLRCWLFNSPEPFGKNFQRTLINVKTTHGVRKLYIPSSKVSKSNHSTLYCNNETMFCEWTITPSNATLFHTKLVTTNSIFPTLPMPSNLQYSTELSEESITSSTNTVVGTSKTNMVPSPILPCCYKWIEPPTEMNIIFGFHNVISLSYEDIEQWVLFYVHRTITNLCIKSTTIIFTIEIEDENKLSRDIVSLQYQLRNNQLYLKGHFVCIMYIVDKYDCEEEKENLCPKRQGYGLKRWHIISFSISGVIAIIDVVLAIYLWHRCRR